MYNRFLVTPYHLLNLRVYQFADCMGWLTSSMIGGTDGNVSSFDDLVLIKPITGYFIKNYVYISKKSLNFKSITSFQIDRNFNYPIFIPETNGFITGEPDSGKGFIYTFSSKQTINGSKLDASTIKEAARFK